MRTRLLLLFVLSGMLQGLYAQHFDPDYSDDDFFLEDSSAFDPVETLNLFGAGTPTRHKSLKGYLPPILNMMDNSTPPSSAVIWAFTYQAMSIQYRSELKQPLSFSYSYVFNRMPKDKDCRFTVSSINQLSGLLKTTGTVLIRDFDQPANCLPANIRKPQTQHYKLKDLYLLFDGQCNEKDPECISSRLPHNKVSRIKILLTQNKPVVALLRVHANFHLLNKEFIEYHKDQPLHPGSKTIVIIGFDDEKQAFEVTFPAGESWGKNGIALLKYTDMMYVSKAYSLVLDKGPQMLAQTPDKPTANKPSTSQPSKVNSPAPTVSHPITKTKNLSAQISMEELFLNSDRQVLTKPMPLHISDNMIVLRNNLSPEQYYQISIRRLSDDSYFYVLNIEKDKKQVHFPINKEFSGKSLEARPISSYVVSGSADFFVPRPRIDPDTGNLIPRGFVKRDPEKEYMVLLFSKEKIDDKVRVLMDNIVYSSDSHSFYGQLCKILRTGPVRPVLKSGSGSSGIQFDSPLVNGTILPVVITLKGQ